MLDKLFPTFVMWLKPRGPTMWLKPRGPTWYISTWLGDSLTTQQRSLLRILSVAHRERLEVLQLVNLLADEHRGRYRWSLRRLAKRLATGTPLVDALEQTPDALSDDAVLALRFGSQSGTLDSTFAMLLPEDLANSENPEWNTKRFWSYWVVLAITIGLLLMFMMTFISPTFKKMFEEFGMRLPGSLLILIAICDGLAKYAVQWILLGLIVTGLLWSSSVRRFFRRTVAPRFVRPIAQLRIAELLRLLALGVDSGRPLAGSLSTLARYHFDSQLRQRLLFARNEMEQGVESWQCLTEANLLTPPQSLAISSAPSNAIRAWTLRRLAAGKQDAAIRRTAISFALLQPMIVLFFGAIVFFVFVSFFSVLITLISSLS